MAQTIEIHVRLLHEGTECARPTQALDLENGLFKILATSDYNSGEEVWEFPPDSIVRSEVKQSQGKEFMLAVASWHRYQAGASLGALGSEKGRIVLDEEHPAGARITMEQGGGAAPFSITCGLAGWFVHTVFVATEDKGRLAFKSMQAALEHIICILTADADPGQHGSDAVIEAIHNFVERFP